MPDLSFWVVIDDAVKIGFGAVISAGTTLLITRSNRRAERQKDLLQMRIKTATEAAGIFNEAHQAYCDLVNALQKYTQMEKGHATQNEISDGLVRQKEAVIATSDSLHQITRKIEVARLNILLLGDKAAAAQANKYIATLSIGHAKFDAEAPFLGFPYVLSEAKNLDTALWSLYDSLTAVIQSGC